MLNVKKLEKRCQKKRGNLWKREESCRVLIKKTRMRSVAECTGKKIPLHVPTCRTAITTSKFVKANILLHVLTLSYGFRSNRTPLKCPDNSRTQEACTRKCCSFTYSSHIERFYYPNHYRNWLAIFSFLPLSGCNRENQGMRSASCTEL